MKFQKNASFRFARPASALDHASRIAAASALALAAGSASAEALKAPAPSFVGFAALDGMLVASCSEISSKDACAAKLAAIRAGIPAPAGPAMPVDSKVETRVVSAPGDMIENYYCLSVQTGAVRPDAIDPETFAYAARGTSFSRTEASKHARWLSTPTGRRCADSVAALGLKAKAAPVKATVAVVLNPAAHLDQGAEEHFDDALVATYVHERLHATLLDPKAKARARELWRALSEGARAQFKRERPSYDWSKEDVAAREHFSYSFERSPEEALELMKAKDAKSWLSERGSRLCKHCVADDPAVQSLAKELSKLKPAELLKRVEDDGVAVKILPSGRRTPKKFFTWGSIRVDEGKLDQISRAEGSMGKTLCKGERNSPTDRATVVLASDAPFSTLLHEYLHALQIRKDRGWCAISKRLWSKPAPDELESRMIRDREWDVRRTLLETLDSPSYSLEDQASVVDGAISEADARKGFDPAAAALVESRGLREKLSLIMLDYVAASRAK